MAWSEKILLISRFELLDNLADILRAVARTNEQRIRCLHDNQIVHADRSYELACGPEEIAFCIERVARPRKYVFAWPKARSRTA